jgi:hypothetical protein
LRYHAPHERAVVVLDWIGAGRLRCLDALFIAGTQAGRMTGSNFLLMKRRRPPAWKWPVVCFCERRCQDA